LMLPRRSESAAIEMAARREVDLWILLQSLDLIPQIFFTSRLPFGAPRGCQELHFQNSNPWCSWSSQVPLDISQVFLPQRKFIFHATMHLHIWAWTLGVWQGHGTWKHCK
jgi:hypothetical protein